MYDAISTILILLAIGCVLGAVVQWIGAWLYIMFECSDI